jgi:acetyltransferase-like isoleucine patch superfamily enzyme
MKKLLNTNKLKNIIPTRIKHFIITLFHQYKYNLIVGKKTYISSSKFGNNCAVGDNCNITNCVIDKYSYITDNSKISCAKIGKFCSIGNNLRIGMATHYFEQFVSTSPIFYSKYTNLKKSFVNKNKIITHKFVDKSNLHYVEIGNDVWIGADVTILDGIKIGDGAIIGASSLVTKNVDPYTIVGGVPAKTIKLRYSKTQIKKLLKIKWWNKNEKWISSNSNAFLNIKKFINKNYR